MSWQAAQTDPRCENPRGCHAPTAKNEGEKAPRHARWGPFQPVRPEKARKQVGATGGGALYNDRTRPGGVAGQGQMGNLGQEHPGCSRRVPARKGPGADHADAGCRGGRRALARYAMGENHLWQIGQRFPLGKALQPMWDQFGRYLRTTCIADLVARADDPSMVCRTVASPEAIAADVSGGRAAAKLDEDT